MIQPAESNHVVWYVLNKIKRSLIYANAGSTARYIVRLTFSDNGHISSHDEFEVFKKLVAWNVLRISQRKLIEEMHVEILFEVIQPTFNQVYKRFQELQILAFPNINSIKTELALSYNKNILNDPLKQERINFSKYYLQREIVNFEATLKHFFEMGTVNKEDYTLLTMNSKIIRKFLERDIPIKKKRKVKRPKHPLISQQLPLPITGEIVIKGLTESLKELGTKSQEYSGPKFPYKIPTGTHWHNVIIKFLDDERVEIHVKRLKHITDYLDMGMIGKGKPPRPGEQWIFLRVLAIRQGELTIKDPEAKEKYKKQKRALSETLRNYFSIDYDPFYPYQSSPEKLGNSYKIKLLLLPPHKTRSDQYYYEEKSDDSLGIQEFLTEETSPQTNY